MYEIYQDAITFDEKRKKKDMNTMSTEFYKEECSLF